MICVGVVLAGGRSLRFGAEKAVVEVDGAPMLARVRSVLAQGCGDVAINAPAGSAAAGLAVRWGAQRLDDPPGLAAGPLAGVLAGLHWAHARAADWLATAPCDTPNLPPNLVARLLAAMRDDADAVAACTHDRPHPLCTVWRVSSRGVLEDALANGAHPPVRRILEAFRAVEIAFEDASAFANVNTPDDLATRGA